MEIIAGWELRMGLKEALIDLQCEMVAERTLVNPLNISWLQYDILLHLVQEESLLPSQLSILLGVSRTRLSKALKGLKSVGYVQQSPSRDDGRELCTSITAQGRSLMANIFAQHTALYETACHAFTVAEQVEFARLAQKLSATLKKNRSERGQ